MEKGLLADVLEAEKEVQDLIKEETKRASMRVDEAKNKAEARVEEAKRGLSESLAHSVSEAEEAAGERVRSIIAEVERVSVAFDALSAEALKAIVMRHIGETLPEA